MSVSNHQLTICACLQGSKVLHKWVPFLREKFRTVLTFPPPPAVKATLTPDYVDTYGAGNPRMVIDCTEVCVHVGCCDCLVLLFACLPGTIAPVERATYIHI